MNSDMKTNPSTLVRIYVSLFLEGNGLTLFYKFQHPCLHRQLLLVQIHNLSEPCKQPMIQQQTSYILRVQILVLYIERSRWNTFSIMWRVVVQNVKYATGSCPLIRNLNHTSGQLIVIVLPTNVPSAPNHMRCLSTRGSTLHQLGSIFAHTVAMLIFPSQS